LLTLPGVGEYTAAAVAAFAGGRRTVVIDTNIRRVHARVLNAAPHAAPSLSAAERALAARLLPQDTQTSIQWNVGIMELGALICKARAPQCQICPLQQHCAWYATGESLPEDSTRPRQLWHGTDRQMRGKIMAHLRDTPTSVTEEDLRNALRITTEDQNQFTRCLAPLTQDGLAVHNAGKIALPGTRPSKAPPHWPIVLSVGTDDREQRARANLTDALLARKVRWLNLVLSIAIVFAGAVALGAMAITTPPRGNPEDVIPF